jgi:hypothetical protein
VDLVLQVQADLLLDQADLVLLELEDLLELVLRVLLVLVLVLQVELLALVALVVDQVRVAVVAGAVQLVHSVKVDQETLLRLESQREQSVKNSNYAQHLALVELLFHAVMATQLSGYVVVHRFKTSQTRLMPMQVS